MAAQDGKRKPRSFLGIYFECCRVYGRLYQNAEGTAYAGGCPSCGKRLRVAIGDGGTGRRFFRAR